MPKSLKDARNEGDLESFIKEHEKDEPGHAVRRHVCAKLFFVDAAQILALLVQMRVGRVHVRVNLGAQGGD